MNFRLGPAIRRVRKEQTSLTLENVADALELTPTTISRYERGLRTPSDENLQQIFELLDTSREELESIAEELDDDGKEAEQKEAIHVTAPSHYVTSKDDVSDWRNRVIRDTSLSDEEQLILMSLPAFMDEISWIIPITEETFVQETGRERSLVDGYWEEAIGSEYVERIGDDIEWVLRLVLPD